MNIDMKGKTCPIPVVEAKKSLREMQSGEKLVVVVDNHTAVENLQRMAEGLGHSTSFAEMGNAEYNVTIVVGSKAVQGENSGAWVVAIGRDRMGAGSEELGKLLMKSYLYSLREMESPPSCILFFNGGVGLACEGSAALEDLKTLQEKGTGLLACGTCLNYYELSEKLAVGSVTNMDTIATTMANAAKLVNL